MSNHKLPDYPPPWPQFATGAVLSTDEDDDNEDAGEEPLDQVEYDDCLGPDDPGVGPWIFDFYD